MTRTLTADNLYSICDAINFAKDEGKTVTVQGREVHAKFGKPASTWGTGSLSVKVRGRSKSTQGEVWVKAGQTVTIEYS